VKPASDICVGYLRLQLFISPGEMSTYDVCYTSVALWLSRAAFR